MAKIRLDIKSKGDKKIKLNGIEYNIPKITLYHRKFFRTYDLDEDLTIHQMIMPAIKGILDIDEDLTSEEYEFLTITLLAHNKLLHEEIEFNGEVFKLSDMELCSRNVFEYDGEVFLFRKPTYEELFDDPLDALNNLQIDTNYDFYEMPAIFFIYGRQLSDTIRIKGSLGNYIKGLNFIIERFFNENEYINLRR